MKRLLSLLLAVVFAMGLSGCFQPLDKDGMVYHEPAEYAFMTVNSKDVFESGYYGMQFLYNDIEPSYQEEYHVTVYFKSSTDSNVDWEVYVRDYSIPDGYVRIFDSLEPDLYNEGNMELVSGQWIYVRCISKASDSDTPPQGAFEASYFEGTGQRIEFTPDQEFKRFVDAHSMIGVPEDWPYYSADVTGDGIEDRCVSVTSGSGVIRTRTLVYDMQNHVGYTLSGMDYDYYAVGVEDGRLIVKEKKADTDPREGKAVTGTVKLVDGELVFVPDT